MDPDPTADRDPVPSEPRRSPLRFLVPVLGAGAAAALVALLVYGVLTQSPSTRIDERLSRDQATAAPGYRLQVLRAGSLGPRLDRAVAPALKDRWVQPRELRGTPYVLNIWASWCIPCREEAPLLERQWRAQRPRGVLFVGLNMQDFREDARSFMDGFGVDYLNIRDPTNETSRRYGATGLPETFFVSARGQVVNHVIGVVSADQLRRGIAAAVSGRPEAAREGGPRRKAR